MKLNAGCELHFDVQAETPMVLMLRPRSGAGQWIVSEEYDIVPSVPVVEYTDMYGNLCQRFMAPVGSFQVRTMVVAQTEEGIDTAPGAPLTLVQDLPDDLLHYLIPSRYCPADQPRIAKQATTIVAGLMPGYDQVEAIRHWINTNLTYQYGTSNGSTSALETLQQRIGVCRDFTHLGISLCRSLSIPARMVVGYLHELKPMDLHAWFEAYVDGRWYTFDATQTQPKGHRITVAYGRDAADVAFVTQFGPAILTSMTVWTDAVEEVTPDTTTHLTPA
jgi:transglutaminase-like putative cysteine protease